MKLNKLSWLPAMTLSAMLPLQTIGQVGLDPGFSTGTGAEDAVQTLAIQNDGKIIAAGLFFNINGTANTIGIGRLNTNGAVDATFNAGTSVDFGISSAVVQTNGKVIIGGGFTKYQGVSRNGIAGINTNGTLDTTFTPGTGVNDIINSVALQSDGKAIIAGAFTTYNGTGRNGIARVNSDGSLDTTFDPGPSVDNLVRVVAMLPDGRVIIGGDFTTFNGVSRNRIACLNTNGTLDTSFNPGVGANGSIYSVAIQPNGKVIVAGSFTSIGGSPRSRIARLLPNGSLDSSFGAGTDSTVLALTLQTDGKVVLGGQFTSVNAASNIRLARLLLTDASVSPVITNLVVTGGNTTLNWISSANKIYRVDYTPLVYPANWTSLVPNVTATGNSASFTNNAPGTLQRFYRVALLPF